MTFTTSKQSANATLFKNPSQNVCRHGHETHTWTKRRVRVRRHTVRQRFPQLYLKVNKVKQNKRLEESKWLNRTKGTEKKIKWKQSKTNQANYVTTVINQELKKNEVNKGNERAETTMWPKNDSQQASEKLKTSVLSFSECITWLWCFWGCTAPCVRPEVSAHKQTCFLGFYLLQ